MIGEKNHYLPFCDAFKKETSESERPSLVEANRKQKPLPFSASTQHRVESCYDVKMGESCTRSAQHIVESCYNVKKGESCARSMITVQGGKNSVFPQRNPVFPRCLWCNTTLPELFIREHYCSDTTWKRILLGYEPICTCEDEDVRMNSILHVCAKEKNLQTKFS